MVKIIVLGHGLIPRSKGIAPHIEPFEVDLKTLRIICAQEGLIVKMYNPVTGNYDRCTYKNHEKMYKIYDEIVVNGVSKEEEIGNPVKKEDIKIGQVEKTEEVSTAIATTLAVTPVETKEENKEGSYNKKKKDKYHGSFKPINNPEESNN